MTILAKVYKGEDAVIDAEVGIFDGNDCRASILADADGYVCLTVPGEGQGDVLTFKVRVGDEIYNVKQTLIYQDDAIIGSVREPYRIQIDESTGIETNTINITDVMVYTRDGQLIIEADVDYVVYDAIGRTIYAGTAPALTLPRGVYIISINGATRKIVL